MLKQLGRIKQKNSKASKQYKITIEKDDKSGNATLVSWEHIPKTGTTDTLPGVYCLSITGIKTTHGPLTFKFGPFSKTIAPGSEVRIGRGAIGFNIQLDGKTIVNLSDTLLHTSERQAIHRPDVLMIPIGGKAVQNTMDVNEALQAVKIIQQELVIPCHYNCPAFFTKKYNHADDKMFKTEVEKAGGQV